METLNRDNISIYFDEGINQTTLSLTFNYKDGYVGEVETLDKYKHTIVFKDPDRTATGLENPSIMWIYDYDLLVQVIDEKDSLPDFKFIYESKEVTLKGFIKEYLIEGNLLQEIEEELERFKFII